MVLIIVPTESQGFFIVLIILIYLEFRIRKKGKDLNTKKTFKDDYD